MTGIHSVQTDACPAKHGLFLPGGLAVDEHKIHTSRALLSASEGGVVTQLVGVKNENVRKEAGAQHAAVGILHALGGKLGHFVDGFLHGEYRMFKGELLQKVGEGSVKPGMRCVGDIVEVKILGVDLQKKRIQLTMKL